MKTYIFKAIVAITLVVISAVSCQKKTYTPNGNDTTPKVSQDDTNESDAINGDWNLVNVFGGIAGTNQLYQPGDITWTIDSTNSTVIISYASGIIDYTGFAPGTYSFQTTSSNGNINLIVDNRDFGTFTNSNNELLVDQNVAACGLYYKFER